MSDKLKDTHGAIAHALGELSERFQPQCKLTFIMRDPTNKEAYILAGDDNDLEGVIEVIRRSQSVLEIKLTPEDLLKQRLGM